MSDVVMPRLSDSMEEGTILRWLKASGEPVRSGEDLVEIETDKANMTYGASATGVLEIVAPEGATLAVGALIARLGADDASAAPASVTSPAPTPAASAANLARGVKASPVARRIARELGVDLASVRGSGPGGRIVRADVEAHAGAGAAPADTEATAAAPPAEAPAPTASTGAGKGETTAIPLSRLQQTVARRMAETKATVPEFTLTTEVDMAAATALREQLKAIATEHEPSPSYNDLIVKAAAAALRAHPRANGAYRDSTFELHSRVNVGIAVAGADALVVPTIFDADRKHVREISADARALAARVRAGQITPPELSGGTFTVSNLGMHGVTRFTPIVNAGQAAILGVGALRTAAVVRDDRIVAGTLMDLTLTCDHRILYGADAAEFLAHIRMLLEAPLALLS